MSDVLNSARSSSSSLWALQVNGEIPRSARTGPDQLKEKLECIVRSSNTTIKNLRIRNTEDERREITELEADDEPSSMKAKTVAKYKLPSKKELDMSLPYRLPDHRMAVDLTPLLSALLPISQVVEDDTLWDPNSLLAEVQLQTNEERLH